MKCQNLGLFKTVHFRVSNPSPDQPRVNGQIIMATFEITEEFAICLLVLSSIISYDKKSLAGAAHGVDQSCQEQHPERRE